LLVVNSRVAPVKAKLVELGPGTHDDRESSRENLDVQVTPIALRHALKDFLLLSDEASKYI